MGEVLTEAARLLFQGGTGWIAAVVLGAVVYILYQEQTRSYASRIAEAIKMVEANRELMRSLEANSIALEANNRAMEARTRATEDLGRLIANLIRDAEFHDERVKERLDGLSKQTEKGFSDLSSSVRECIEDGLRRSGGGGRR